MSFEPITRDVLETRIRRSLALIASGDSNYTDEVIEHAVKALMDLIDEYVRLETTGTHHVRE